MIQELLTLDEVAAYLKVSRDTVYRMAQKGKIPAVKVGNQWRFAKSEVTNWLEANRNSNDLLERRQADET